MPPLRKKLSEIKLPLIKTETKSVKGNARDFTVGFSVFLHDLAFMIFAGIVTTLTVYRFNYGKWRFYALWLIVFGFALYRRFLRIPILALAEIIRFIIKIIAVYAICFIMAPIKAILRKAKDFYRMLKIKKMQTNIIKYSKKEKMRMLSMIKDRGPFAEK